MTEELCPRCGTAIPDETRGNVGAGGDAGIARQCPRCLLRPPWDKPHPVAITLGPGQSFVPPSIEELSGHITGYEVEALIGQGGMGAVYLGRQISLDRPVAIKILPPQIAERAGFRERFAQEGRALAKLNHPNIVAVHDFGQAGPYAMLVMELVEGANLREVLAQGRLSPAEALEIIPQLCDALSYAHDVGVVHRDIKPENLLFDGRGRLKITDFGLAKLVAAKSETEGSAQDMTADGSAARTLNEPTQGVVGTVHYMAPEQLENPRSVDHRADIYALGVVFYEMLTGELPIGRFGPPSQVVDGESDPVARIAIDVRLDDVVLRALEKHPEKRYGSASAVMHDIDEIENSPAQSKVQSVAAKILPGEHRQRVRESVHRAGEAAGAFAASSFGATTGFVSQAKDSWLNDTRVEIPAYTALATIIMGTIAAFAVGNEPGGDDTALLVAFITGIITLVFSRISLHRESESDDTRPLLMTRFFLGIGYAGIIIPVLIAPFIGSFVLWTELYGFPRDVGQAGWVRDWVRSISSATIVAALAWLAVLLIHVVFPKVFSALFHPFVRPASKRVSIPIAVLLFSLIGAGFFLLNRMPYDTYATGMTVDNEDWGSLSPKDLRDLQSDLRDQERRERDVER